jgi:hypothetical protein
MSKRFLIGVALVLNLMAVATHAQVMQSASYSIESDSINFGGARSSSTTYALEDTLGEIATGESSSTSYRLGAGYQHTLIDYLSISSSPDVVLSPTLGGLTGGTSNGSTTVTVVTDGAAGYQLTIVATNTPAMQSPNGQTLANYAPAGADPDFAFGVATGDARFGYSPEGVDIATRFKDNGSTCNSGAGDTVLACWDGITTTPAEFARRGTPNHPTGTDTKLNFRVGLGANAAVQAGTYYATTTITAIQL